MRLDITIEEYHADKTAISSSAFYYLSKCPAYYQLYKKGSFDKDAAYFRVGSAVHTRILEPFKFDDEFVVMPKIDGRTTEGKKLKQEFQEKAEGKIVLSASEFNQISEMANSALSHKFVVDLLSRGGEAEVSLFWEEQINMPEDLPTVGCHRCEHINEVELFGPTICKICEAELYPDLVWTKTRPDYLVEGTIVDVKTTKSISGFQSSMNTFLYDSQAALQIAGAEHEGYRIDEYYWVVIEKEPPYLTAVFQAKPETLKGGKEKYQGLLVAYKKALATGDWYAYPEVIEI